MEVSPSSDVFTRRDLKSDRLRKQDVTEISGRGWGFLIDCRPNYQFAAYVGVS